MEPKDFDFPSSSSSDVLKALGVSDKGLSEKEAKKRIKENGKNALPKNKKGEGILLFLKQFNSSLIYILFIAAFISWKFEHFIDAYVILFIVFINAIIGFFQRWRADKVLEALKKMVTIYTRVVRNGIEVRIPAESITVGDIVILEAGDRVPADIRILESQNIRSDEASLTGESIPVEKSDDVIEKKISKEESPKNMLFMGTALVSGYSKGVIVAVGTKTRLGEIAQVIKKIKYQKSHFEKKIDELVVQMGFIAFLGAFATFAIGFYLKGLEFFDIFLFSVAALVAGVPEGLPAVLTVVLAIGASRMAKKNAIIKHLPSVETLGVANVICTDKTGTLTQNILTVKKIFVGSKLIDVSGVGIDTNGSFSLDNSDILSKYYEDLDKFLKGSLYTSDATVTLSRDETNTTGEPVEVAMDIAALKGGLAKSEVLDKVKVLEKIPFDTRYKYKASLINFGTEGHPDKSIFVSGAFEILLERSTFVYENGKIEELTKEKREEILNHAIDMAEDALKVIGSAFKKAPENKDDLLHEDISNLVFSGFFGMIDPPKENVKEALDKCKTAGIRVLMLTGDHKTTAVAVAKDVGLIPKEPKQDGMVLTESDLEGISDEDFKEAVRKVTIFARVTPETKLKIAKTLQEDNNIVAMTGDGVNDAPALKQANIGVSMGISGTDVAKEAAGIILTDDNFSSVVDAVIEGRVVFDNVKKTSFYLITTNMAEHATIITALSIGLSLPLLPIQLLWLNLVTDGITVIALAMEPKEKGILKQKPRSKDERIVSKDVLPLLFFTVFLMVIGTIFLFTHFLPQGIDKARTVAFSFMAFSQLFNVINMRSLNLSIFKLGFFSSKFMAWALIISVIVQFIVIDTPFFQNIFNFERLSVGEWGLIIFMSSLILFVVEIYKVFKRKRAQVSEI